jgi:hypothetical protein
MRIAARPHIEHTSYNAVATGPLGRCIASDCMMWRKMDDYPAGDRGFCGLAYAVRLP